MTNEVERIQAEPALQKALYAPQEENMLAVISRAATDPACDVGKMERLLVMLKELKYEQAWQEFSAAMNACQASMGRVAADLNNPQTRSMYASYAALDRALRPAYTANGFSLSFDTGEGAPEGCSRVLCYVSHAGGHTRTYKVDMPNDGKGAKGGDVMTKTHAQGAAISYGMRYLLKLIFNVAIGEDDTDGNLPENLITDAQAATIQDMLDATESNVKAFCGIFKVDAVGKIPARCHAQAMELLRKKAAKK